LPHFWRYGENKKFDGGKKEGGKLKILEILIGGTSLISR